MGYTISTEFWRGLRLRATISVNPPKDNPEYVIPLKQVRTNREGGSYSTLVFSPRMYLKLLPVGLETSGRIAIPMHLIKPFGLQLRKVYSAIIEKGEMYTVDDSGALIIDRGMAKSAIKGLSLYEEKLYIMPAVVASSTRNVKGVLLVTSGNISATLTIYEVPDLLERIDNIDPLTLTVMMAILEEQFINGKKLDRIENKLNDVLRCVRGNSTSAVINNGLGTPTTWKGANNIWRN